jgi:NAD(P)-dependent dehydrogenase (short-subunit alcohol dehydrogenase family)
MMVEDKTALIYGGGAIGGAVARAFAGAGAHVYLAGRTRARLEAVANDIGDAADVAEVDALDERAVAAARSWRRGRELAAAARAGRHRALGFHARGGVRGAGVRHRTAVGRARRDRADPEARSAEQVGRRGEAAVPAGDRGRRPAADRELQQDAGVHAVDVHAVTRASGSCTFAARPPAASGFSTQHRRDMRRKGQVEPCVGTAIHGACRRHSDGVLPARSILRKQAEEPSTSASREI